MGPVNALFVSPDLQSRMRFKQVARSIPEFKNTLVSSSLYEAILRLGDRNTNCDVIYLANHYARDVVLGFVEDAKRSPQGKDSAYMMVVHADEANAVDIAQRVFDGADGFLVEPFSVDSVSESIKIAMNLRTKRVRSRQEVGFELLIKTQIATMDKLAQASKAGGHSLDHAKVLERISASIAALPQDLQTKYMELLVERFAAISTPPIPSPATSRPTKEYRIVRQ